MSKCVQKSFIRLIHLILRICMSPIKTRLLILECRLVCLAKIPFLMNKSLTFGLSFSNLNGKIIAKIIWNITFDHIYLQSMARNTVSKNIANYVLYVIVLCIIFVNDSLLADKRNKSLSKYFVIKFFLNTVVFIVIQLVQAEIIN